MGDFEKYGRRKSLRFHNVPIIQDQFHNTDAKIVNLCTNQLGVSIFNLQNDVIDNSHTLGKINRDGQAQIICRFRIWKVKNQVYRAKIKLKGNLNRT